MNVKTTSFFIFLFLFFGAANANSTENITIEKNKVDKNYDYCYCIESLKKRMDVYSPYWPGGINKFAWTMYGNNPYFSWINMPGETYDSIHYGAGGARTIYAGTVIPLEAMNANDSLNAYGIFMHEILLEKYTFSETPRYLLINSSVNLHKILPSCLYPREDIENNEFMLSLRRPMHVKERPEFSFKWNFNEADKKKILEYLNPDRYLFTWNRVVKYDDSLRRLVISLPIEGVKYEWMESGKVKRSEGNQTINITKDDDSITLTLKRDVDKVIVETIIGNASKRYEYVLKEEDGDLNVYEKSNEQERKILKDKDNKNVFVISKYANRSINEYIIELREKESEALLKRSHTRHRWSPVMNFSNGDENYIKEVLRIAEYRNNTKIIKTEVLDNDTLFVKVKFQFEDYPTYIVSYLVMNNKDKDTSYAYEFVDISKFEARNESKEIKIHEFENPHQYIDAFYNIESKICFRYSDDGKEGSIKFENKTINWEIKESVENESFENNTLKIWLKGGKNIRFFPFLIAKNETTNETIIYGISVPCKLSEIYNSKLAADNKINKYVGKILFQEGVSFLSMLKIMHALYYEKVYFDGACGDNKNHTLTFKFHNFEKKDIEKTKLLITKICNYSAQVFF